MLTLAGAQTFPLTFSRSTPAEFRTRVAHLRDRSQIIIQAQAAAQTQLRALEAHENFIVEIDRLIGNMEGFDSQADFRWEKFQAAEKAYERITGKAAAYLVPER
jgi:hypothetical protein